MLKKTVFIFLTLTFALAGIASDNRREKILSITEEELREIVRLSKQQGDRDPELLLKISELHMERARLQREGENEKFLAQSPEQRRRADQSEAYAASTKSFKLANRYAHAVIKRFPRYKDMADVYYVLAYNLRELRDYNGSQRYFDLATRQAKKGSPTYYRSRLALAESFYNKGEFAKAIPLYEEALRKVDGTWWTKDAYNLAWSYFRQRKYSQAIDTMKEVHRRSENGKYINMSYFVERDIGLFYVDAHRTDEAIQWYKSQKIDFAGYLVKIARSLVPQGKFTQAETLLKEAGKIVKKPEERIDLLLLQMELFDKYEKISPHLKAAEELTSQAEAGKLNDEQSKRLDYQVSKKAAELQKSAASDLYKDVKKVRRQRARWANRYFALMARLKPGDQAKPLFYQGETLFAVGNFSGALAAYQKAYSIAVKEKDNKIRQQAMEGMLSALGQPSLAPAEAERYYVPVYESYLKQEPDSPRAKVIRQKLYKIQMEKKNLPGAEAVLRDYAQHHSEDQKTQEAMLAGIMEEYRKKKDYNRVKDYVGLINDGTYRVSKKYADALRELMTKIQIEDAQSSLDKGEKATALKGYMRLYHHADATPHAKANAAYNMAALYYELGDATQSYTWAVTALKEMETSEVRQFSDSFLAISTNLFLRQRFQQSADLGMRTVAKLCKQGVSAKNTAFKNAAFLWLAEGKTDKAEETLGLGVSCGVDTAPMNEVRLELAKEYTKQKRWDSLAKIIEPILASNVQAPLTIIYVEELRNAYAKVGENAQAAERERQENAIYHKARSQNVDVPVEALDIIAFQIVRRLEAKKSQVEAVTLAFPEQQFNRAVKSKLALLDGLAVEVQEVQKTGSGRGIVRAYKELIAAYERFARELRDFTPEGKPPEYVESFRKAMAGVWGPIAQNAEKRRAEVADLIRKNHVLSLDNFSLLAPNSANPVVRYQRSHDMVLMDRGGRR